MTCDDNLRSLDLQFHTSTGGDAHIALAISTPDIQFENNSDLCGHPRAIPVQVIESHDPSVRYFHPSSSPGES